MPKMVLDLRGLSCPQPVFETKRAIENPSFEELEVIVDTKTSVENIQRLLANFKGILYTVEEGEDIKVTISRRQG